MDASSQLQPAATAGSRGVTRALWWPSNHAVSLGPA